MPYIIKSYTKTQARKLGVVVKPSKVKGKKIDVFKNGQKIASVGALKTIKKVEDKPTSTTTYFRVDMCSFPIISLKDLKTKLNSILKKYEIKKDEIML